MNSHESWSFKKAIEPSRAALVELYKPMLAIQGVGAIMVIAYYQSESVRTFSEQLMRLKEQGGILAAVLVASIVSVFVPEIARKLIERKSYRFPPTNESIFNLLFFGVIAAYVYGLYQFQDWMFGSSTDAVTVAKKVVFDMGFFSVFISGPVCTTLRKWQTHRFNFQATKNALTPYFWRDHVFPVILLIWGYWIPMVICAYALPLSLQFWHYLFAQAAYSMLLIHATSHRTASS